MLNIPDKHVFEIRSTGRITAKKMQPFIDILRSSEILDRYDRIRSRDKGYLKFDSVCMMTIVSFIEMKKLTFAQYRSMIAGAGGQRILKNLGMPIGSDGRYMSPSDGWISQFRNHEYKFFKNELNDELQQSILKRFREGDASITLTVDSTPLEASRYSDWADFNVHYGIRMAKSHIVMISGHPLFNMFTNGNKGDCPEFIEMLQRYDTVPLKNARFLSDGAYASHEAYLEVFLKTGTVMSSNIREDGIFHEEATYPKLVGLYNKLFREPDFKPLKQITPEHMLRYLASHGQGEKVGWFLRNLDLMRGDRIHRQDALDRHVCETMHHAMKRWVNFDVRGLQRKFAAVRTELRLFVCTILSFIFKPYC